MLGSTVSVYRAVSITTSSIGLDRVNITSPAKRFRRGANGYNNNDSAVFSDNTILRPAIIRSCIRRCGTMTATDRCRSIDEIRVRRRD